VSKPAQGVMVDSALLKVVLLELALVQEQTFSGGARCKKNCLKRGERGRKRGHEHAA